MSTEPKMIADGAVPELLKQLRATIKSDDPLSWDVAWKNKITPWERSGQVQPPLIEAFESNELGLNLPRKGKALVPGCGRGWDPIYLGSVGLDAYGADISERAVEIANEQLKESTEQGVKITGSVTFEKGDFFKLEKSDEDKFDVIYDYTFFVAIPPSLRPSWGKQMRKLVKPGGHLIALAFPLRPYDEHGPPYYVQPEHYSEVLGDRQEDSDNPEGWEKVVDKAPAKSLNEEHTGRERLLVFKRV